MALEGRPVDGRPKGRMYGFDEKPDFVTVQIGRILDVDSDSPKGFVRTHRTWNRFMAPVRYVKLTDFDTRQKVAAYLYNFFGAGTFNVFFRIKKKNSKFQPRFHCTAAVERRCPYNLKGKCRIWVREPEWICRNNRKTWITWNKVATLEVIPIDNPYSSEEFTFRWVHEADKLRRMFFWRDTNKQRALQKREEEERWSE